MSRFVMLLLFVLIPWVSANAAITHTEVRYGDSLEEISLHSTSTLRIKKSFVLPSPARLVVDIARLRHGKGVRLPRNYQGRMLKALRFGQFDTDTSRLVFDLGVNELSYQTVAEGSLLRVTLKSTVKDSSGAPAASQPAKTQIVDFPTPLPKPTHLAKQAARPIIVIDAGHGGKDSGAIGRSGTIEKRVTLAYAQALRKALLKTGRYRVAMTRSDDRYLFLKERVAVARRAKGNLFISIHADSNPRRDARGLSVYTLSDKASDAEAAALAEQENKADIIGGLDLSVEDAAVANILIDLAQRETNNKSSRLAELVVKHAKKRVPLITNPHRYAGFRVLKAPDIPSILVEIGFLSNRSDEKRIQQTTYRERVVQSLIQAIDGFFED